MPDQHLPLPSTGDLWLDVIRKHNYADNLTPELVDAMMARRLVGIQRYGTPLQPFNGRDAIRDTREELLDAIVYLEQAAPEGLILAPEATEMQADLIEMIGRVERR